MIIMAPSDDPRTFGRTRLSFADTADIDTFVEMLGRFERGEISPDDWRKFRLLRGTYSQRQDADYQMLRIKIPQGILDAAQLEVLADVSERHSRGFGHISTRQNVQLHFVPLHDMEPAMRLLADAGLTTREACGNSVRNITACPYAGVARDEVFDVTPYAEAMTRYLLRHPLSSSLPRKFKIAFEGCTSEDHAFTSINDIGWRAALAPDGSGRRGFRVLVAGGTAIMCRSGASLFEFLPASDILMVAEAVVRVFHRYGDYEHKQRNRLKFLLKTMGWDKWFAAFEQELADVRASGRAQLPFDPENPPVEAPPALSRTEPPSLAEISALVNATAVRGPGIVPEVRPHDGRPGRERTEWLHTNLQPQKQSEYSLVTVTLTLGDVTAGQMRALAALARAYGDGTVRVTVDQNLVLRWVRSGQVPGLYRRLAAAGLGLPGAGTIADVTSCPGAESCRLAVTQSRGLGRLIESTLRERPAAVRQASSVRIKISGCPNGCGQNHVATIGFQGSIRRLGERVVPQYFMTLGGGSGPNGASFGRLTAKIPARRVPDAVDRMIRLYEEERTPGETAPAFFNRVEPARARAAVADLERLTAEDALPSDFVDPGEDHAFNPEVLDGECSA
jgi:sulfite reductase beta subunit-like hemoprotein